MRHDENLAHPCACHAYGDPARTCVSNRRMRSYTRWPVIIRSGRRVVFVRHTREQKKRVDANNSSVESAVFSRGHGLARKSELLDDVPASYRVCILPFAVSHLAPDSMLGFVTNVLRFANLAQPTELTDYLADRKSVSRASFGTPGLRDHRWHRLFGCLISYRLSRLKRVGKLEFEINLQRSSLGGRSIYFEIIYSKFVIDRPRITRQIIS